MANPLIPQGVLNRLRGSIIFPLFPELNITASYLGEEGINLTPEGEVTDIIDTMTGTVLSPAPYQRYTVEVELLKTQGLSDQFKTQIETNSEVGDFLVRTDASTLSGYPILNGSITNASAGRLNGKQVGYMVTLKGFYLVNAALFDAS